MGEFGILRCLRSCRNGLPKAIAAIAAASVLVGFSESSLAQGPGWTANSTVVKLVVTENGGINVRLSPELTGCVSQGGYGSIYASIYPDHAGIDRMKADLLAAYLNGSTVSLYLSDNTCRVGELLLGGWSE